MKRQLKRAAADDRGARLMLETKKRELEEKHAAKQAEMQVLRVDLEVSEGCEDSCLPRPASNGNTVRNFPTHGQLSAAQGNLTVRSRS